MITYLLRVVFWGMYAIAMISVIVWAARSGAFTR